MKKLAIWVAACCGALLVLLVAAILIIPSFIDVESYTPTIEQKVQHITGRSFTLGKDLDVSIFPWTAVSFNNLQLGNPEQFGEGDFAKVGSFEARVKLLPLLFKNIEIKTFILDSPEIHLIKNKEGQVNWSFGTDKKMDESLKAPTAHKKEKTDTKDAGFTLGSLEVGEFEVTNGRIIYEDRSSGIKKVIDGINFELQDVSLDHPISLKFTANVDNKPVAVTGSLGPIGKTPGKGKIMVDLAISLLEEMKINLQGNIENPATDLSYDIKTDIDAFSPRKLLEKLEITLPIKTADPAVLQKVSCNLAISGTQENISLNNSKIVLDDSSLIISADVKEMTKPDISFDLKLDRINLDRYLPPVEEKKENEVSAPKEKSDQPQDGQPAPQQKIDYEPLRRLILEGNMQIGELIAHGAKVQNVVVKITGKDGIFDLAPCKLDLYQGNLDLVGNFNVQQEKPKGALEVKAQNIQVGPLLRDSMKKDILEGGVKVDTSLSFTGDTVDEIKKTLNGKGSLNFLDGAIVGIDIADMTRNFAAGLGFQKPKEKPRTDFAELNVPFTLTNGIFNTTDTNMQSPLMRLNVDGNADLVQELLDLNLNPKIVGTLKGQGDKEQRKGITIPIKVDGTFEEPKYSANMKALVTEDALKDAAKDPETQEKAKDLGKGVLKKFGF